MIKALENNTLGLVLAGCCGSLVLIGLALAAIWALPPSAESGPEESAGKDIVADIASLRSAKPLEEYSEVGARPVFNETRRPVADLADEGEIDELPPIDEVGAPDVELAGIIITPSLRMATLKSKDHSESLVAFEGKPLEGNFGTWQVSRIEERMVTLASAEGEELTLELQVHDAVIKEPPKPVHAADGSTGERGDELVAENGEQGDPEEVLTRAEEIRQRIEERREELRRAAEERGEAEAENYRDAIQTMIQRSRDRAQQQQQQQQQADEEGQ